MSFKFLFLKFKFLSILLVTGFLLLVTIVPPVFAQSPAAGVKQLQDLVQRIINISVGLAFMFATAYLVWSGIKFISSGGEAKPLQDAWRAFTWALLGLLFLVLAWVILLVVEGFTGIRVTSFCLGFPGTENGLNKCS